jgi:hypothetical protein
MKKKIEQKAKNLTLAFCRQVNKELNLTAEERNKARKRRELRDLLRFHPVKLLKIEGIYTICGHSDEINDLYNYLPEALVLINDLKIEIQLNLIQNEKFE